MKNWEKPEVYAVKHKDENIRAASRSGGIFTALSDAVLLKGGVVYGCILTDSFQAIHTRATTVEDRNRMRGSKYIQSNMTDVFRAVKVDLDDGMQVLFSGTSCQIAGLKGFLGKEYDNLFCVDIVCHGVPSPMVWNSYLAWQEKKGKGKVKCVNFRNKPDFGWQAHVESIYLDNGEKIDSEVFKTLFYGHNILRPCCYKCPYKDIMHPGDITIADYWGIDQAAPGFNDNKGVSLVLINNERGQKAFCDVIGCLDYRETKIEDSLQPPLKAPFERPENRDKFWNDFYDIDFEAVVKKYGSNEKGNSLRKTLGKVKRKVKAVLK